MKTSEHKKFLDKRDIYKIADSTSYKFVLGWHSINVIYYSGMQTNVNLFGFRWRGGVWLVVFLWFVLYISLSKCQVYGENRKK